MNGRSVLTAGYRRLRRVPGYPRLRREALQRLRGSATFREVVSRLLAGSTTTGGRLPQRFPAAGTLLAGTGVDALPVTVVSLLDVPAERIEAVVADVARQQLLSAGFRPVLVMCRPELGAARVFGYPVELLIAPEQWDQSDQTWVEYAAARLADVRTRYEASTVIGVSSAGLSQPLRAMLAVPLGDGPSS